MLFPPRVVIELKVLFKLEYDVTSAYVAALAEGKSPNNKLKNKLHLLV